MKGRQHLHCLDSSKSSAKDLSVVRLEIEINSNTFGDNSGSFATGPRTDACHVTLEVMDSTV